MKVFRNITAFFIAIYMSAYSLIFPNIVFADDLTYSFSDIDLKVSVPEELICFTQSTTGNNAFLEKIGANDANEVQSSMKAADIYLEAFSEDISYEIAIVGMKAGSSLSNLNELSEDELNSYYEEYIKTETDKQTDNLTEEMTDKALETINGQPYFRTDITTKSDENGTMYTRKYYTVTRGYIYIYSLQSNENELTDEMTDYVEHIVNSAVYTEVRKSIFENGVFTETLSTIISAGIPIIILVVIYLLITKFGKKGRSKMYAEEAALREEYKKRQQEKSDKEKNDKENNG